MLELRQVSKSFGGVRAADGVSFSLDQGGVTGLIGPNGSGKTTLFHLITGFYALDSGQIFLDGRPIHGRPPDEISRLGLARTFQHSRMLSMLPVRENLLAAAPDQAGERIGRVFLSPGRVRRQEESLRQEAARILETISLAGLADQPAGRLSFGQQKLLELGRALMLRPRMILLDEPFAGVNPTLTRRLVELIGRLAADGLRIFIVEHNVPLVVELCQRLLVMDAGRIIFDGAPEAARRDPGVIEAYLGRAAGRA